MTTIPASAIVNVTPSVLTAGGDALDIIGLLLSTSSRVPVGTVGSFSSPAAVAAYFGSTSQEAALASVYFDGFDTSLAKPGSILIAQYPVASVGAYLRGGSLITMSLGDLQGLSGTLGVVIDGVLKQATISLAAATSFSNAASIIGQALGITGPTVGSITGSIAGGTMTATAVASGTIGVGQVLSGTGVTANTYVSSLISGTGAVGTYGVSTPQTAASQTITLKQAGVSYDSVSGAFVIVSGTVDTASTIAFGSGALATSLKLTSLTGAVLSQGTGAATPAAYMNSLINVTQDWTTFATAFDPDNGSGHTNKQAFSAWTDAQNDRYMYVAWDTDASPTVSAPATTSLGYAIDQLDYSGTCLVYAPDATLAAFVMGWAASIDFEAANGRTTLAFRSQGGLAASVTDQTSANNLIANGYNFYGAYATANDQFVFLYPGLISGPFAWADSYINEIWLNNAFQLALMALLTNAGSIPYNAAGRAQIEASLADPINAGLNFGAFRAGVTLSAAQVSAINASAGADIAGTLSNRGWYLQVGDASPAVRAARGSPPCKFWYVDGQSVQQINLASILVQ